MMLEQKYIPQKTKRDRKIQQKWTAFCKKKKKKKQLTKP
jgi:hypothetical protein